MADKINHRFARIVYPGLILLLAWGLVLASCGDGGGTDNSAPVLLAPNASTGDMVISGSQPAFTGVINTGADLALIFAAEDGNGADLLNATVSVTGGTLTAAQAGFNETFPYSLTAGVSPHILTLTGVAGTVAGTIELTVKVDDEFRLFICDFGSHRIQVYKKEAYELSDDQIAPPLRNPILFTT